MKNIIRFNVRQHGDRVIICKNYVRFQFQVSVPVAVAVADCDIQELAYLVL